MQTIALALFGAVLGATVLPRTAARRTVAQPIPAPVDAEEVVLSSVLAEPSRYFKVSLLAPESFAHRPHRDAWAALQSLAVPSDDPAELDEARAAGQEAWTLAVGPDEAAAAVRAAGVDADVLDVLVSRGRTDDDGLLAAGVAVIDAGDERVVLRGLAPILDDPDGGRDHPLRRELQPVTPARRVVTAALVAAGCAAADRLGGGDWGAAALVALVLGCAVLSLVDVDTMFIDTPTLAATALTSWLFAVPVAYQRGGWASVAAGVGFPVAAVAGLEGLAWVYHRLRGRMGLGGGDTMLLLVTLSVPLLVAGDASLVPAGILAAAVCAMVVRLGLVAARRGSVHDPFAFGPYLCAGWLVGWLAVVAL